MKLFKKFISVLLIHLLVFYQIAFYIPVAHAQEVTPTLTPIKSPSPSPTESPSPTSITTESPAPSSEVTPTPSPWTFEKVELNKEYVSPQNNEVKLTFTKLPDPAGNIKIEEITLTEDQIKQTGSLSDKAYDITSDMKDGEFTYNLSLPIPESSKGKTVEVKFAEELSKISSAEKVENTITKTDTSVSVASLDHMTIFVVVGWNFPDNPDDAIADEGVAMNSIKTISVTGAGGLEFNAAGSTTMSARAAGWDNGDGTKYWEIEFDATAFSSLKLYSKQRSSTTGPRDFKIQYKLGSGGTWTNFGPAGIVVADNWISGVLSDIAFPAEVNNQPSVFVRWLMNSNIAVSGSPVGSAGASNIDDIRVEGNATIINVPAHYLTIQAAINAASEGDTINVAEGTYNENLAINKSLTLQGAGSSQSIINAGESIAIEVTADNVVIDGFEIKHTAVNSLDDMGIRLNQSNGSIIQNNKINNNSLGLQLLDAGNNDILTNDFLSNVVGVYLEGTTDGINTDVGSNGPFYSLSINNNISGNTISNSIILGGQGGDGIYVDAASESNTINANTITSNAANGYYAWKASNNTVTDNTISNNGDNGVHLMGSSGNTVTGNILSSNINNGLWLRSGALSTTSNIITGNTINENGTGIKLQDDFSSNNYVGVVTGNTISSNSIIGNIDYGLSIDDVDPSNENLPINSTHNWWGDQSGPSGEGTGIGDSISTNVDVSPWCLTSDCSSDSSIYSDSSGATLSSTAQDIIVGDLTLENVTGAGSLFVAKYDGVPSTGDLSTGVDGFYYDIQASGIDFPVSIILSYSDTLSDPNYLDEDHFVSLFYYKDGTWHDYKLDTVGTTGYVPSEVTIDKPNDKITATLQHLTPIVPAIDTTAPPVPTLVSPADGAYLSSHTFTADWNDVIDDLSGLLNYDIEFYYGGSWRDLRTVVASQRTNSASYDLTWQWRVRSRDNLGNVSNWSDPWTVTLDTTTSVMSSYNISDTLLNASENTITLSGDISDATSPIDSVKYSIWNSTKTVLYANWTNAGATDGAYDSKIESTTHIIDVSSYPDDTFILGVRGWDKAGNKASGGDFYFTVDKTSPTATISYDITDWTNGTVTASLNPSEAITVTNNSGSSSYTFSDNGTFTFNFVDSAGNTGSATATVSNIDKILPIVSITSPAASAAVNGMVDIRGTVVDDHPHHYWLAIYKKSNGQEVYSTVVNHSDEFSNKLLYSWDTSGQSDGEYQIKFAERDAADNRSSDYVVDISLDNAAPAVPANPSPADQSYINTSNFAFSWSPVADTSAPVTYEWEFSYGSSIKGDGSFTTRSGFHSLSSASVNSPGTPDNIYYWHVRAIDSLGNASAWSSPWKVTVDTVAPALSSKTIFSDWYKVAQTSTFDYSDANGVVSGTPVTCDITSEGALQTCTVTPNVCDAAGNCNTSLVTSNGANIDLTNPTSTITIPSDAISGSTVYLSEWDGSIAGAASDALSDVSGVQISIQKGTTQYFDDSSFITTGSEILLNATYVGGNWSYAGLTSPADGSYTIKSHAIDNAGNMESTYTLTIILDKTIPGVSLTINPAVADASNGWYKTQPEVTLTQTDTNIDRIDYSWVSETGPWTVYTAPFKPSTEGARVLYYRALDKASNYSDIGVKNIKWDQTDLTNGPSNVSVSPNPTSGTTSVVKWEEARDNIGIDRYEIKWSLKNGDKSYTDSVGNNIREHTINNLIEGDWTIEVKAFDWSGKSKSASTDLTVDRTGPSSPTLSISGTSVGSVTLSWTKINGANSYVIWYGTSPGSYQYGANVGDTQDYTVGGLGSGSYYFIVKAVDSSGNQSGNSNEVSTGAIIGAPGVTENTPATGFEENIAENILGEATESAKLTPTKSTPTGTVFGAETKNDNNGRLQWWLWVLFLLLPTGAWFGYRKWKTRNIL